ncbi:hypothetical protein ACFZ8E_07470 [Methylobacterium sp. HMF5984]|uniref:hypothetical protein n=1 Tax=Methylobacterium sp. HMF5984 TaxID=3367370 RepID=UPI003852CD02
MAAYTKPLDIYRYTFQPDLSVKPETMALYVDREYRKVERSIRTLTEALSEVREGTSTGSTITLAPTGVKAGQYTNAVITVGADGRIIAIRNVPVERELPRFGLAGQVLISDGADGAAWQTAPSPIPSGGLTGQVLAKTASGTAWADLPAQPTLPTIPRAQDSTDMVVDAVGTDFALRLRTTGVSPGTYTQPILTIDATGRVLSAQNGDLAGPAPPTAYCSHTSAGTSDTWRLMVDIGFTGSFTADVAFLVDGVETTGTQIRSNEFITATFDQPVDVQGIRITAVDAAGALISGRVQQPDNGFWTTAFEIPRQADWHDGETRFYTIGPSISLTGAVTGTGANEIVTTIAPTGVTAGTYTNATVTVGPDGRITKIKKGEASGGFGGVLDFPFTGRKNGQLYTIDIIGGQIVVTGDSGMQAEDGSTIQAENGSGSISPEA